MQGSELDGHKLLIQLSQRKRLPDDGTKDGKAAKGGKANATKLVRMSCSHPSESHFAICVAVCQATIAAPSAI